VKREGIIFYILLLCLAPLVFSCNVGKKKRMNTRITLKRTDKIPYGTYIAYENLTHIFPAADVEVNRVSPSSYRAFAAMHEYAGFAQGLDSTKTLYFIVSPYFSPNTREFNALMQFIGRGHHVFISAQYWGKEFQDSMKINVDLTGSTDSLWAGVINPVTYDSLMYVYPGYGRTSYMSRYDTNYANILGRNEQGQVNFIQHTYKSGGSMYIHTSPLAFSNFFLLHKSNNSYYNNVLSYLPKSISHIQWDDYFRYGRRFSAFQVIMENPGLSAAFWIVLLIFALIFLFDSKRKQRIIPQRPPLKNASLDFVKTVGRLYYQYRDNRNLALKMTAHLMDHIRTRYNLSSFTLDERFVFTLADKSGYDSTALQKLIYQAKMIQDSPQISDEELMEFNKLTEAFYKHQ
jgi:hypothetical protein